MNKNKVSIEEYLSKMDKDRLIKKFISLEKLFVYLCIENNISIVETMDTYDRLKKEKE